MTWRWVAVGWVLGALWPVAVWYWKDYPARTGRWLPIPDWGDDQDSTDD